MRSRFMLCRVSSVMHVARPESGAIVQKCKAPSVLAVDATAIKVSAGAPISRNFLRDTFERLCGIEALIALNGTIRLVCQFLVRIRLRATSAFDDIEFGLGEVHERTLAYEPPHTANRLVDYCMDSSRIYSSSSSSVAEPTSNTDFSRVEYQ